MLNKSLWDSLVSSSTSMIDTRQCLMAECLATVISRTPYAYTLNCYRYGSKKSDKRPVMLPQTNLKLMPLIKEQSSLIYLVSGRRLTRPRPMVCFSSVRNHDESVTLQ